MNYASNLIFLKDNHLKIKKSIKEELYLPEVRGKVIDKKKRHYNK